MATSNLYAKEDIVNPISPTTPKDIPTTPANKHFYNHPVHSAALASYIIATPALIVKKYFSSFATAFFVADRGLKAIVEYKPTNKIDTLLSVASIVTPVIIYLNPPVGGVIEGVINFAKLYNDSKLSFTTGLAYVIIGGIACKSKEVGIVAEVLQKFSKINTEDKIQDLFTSCIPLVKLVNRDTASALQILANFNKTADMAKEVINKFSSTSPTMTNKETELLGGVSPDLANSSNHLNDQFVSDKTQYYSEFD